MATQSGPPIRVMRGRRLLICLWCQNIAKTVSFNIQLMARQEIEFAHFAGNSPEVG